MQKVLSIDGGGIRGIIPAMVLAEIERRTGKRTAEVFDLAAGTSTSGILALGQTKPGQDGGPEYGAKKLIELYETEGGKIFDRSVWHRIHSVVCLPEERYPSTGIEEVALESFGDVRLAQALTEVLVPSYEIEKRGPWFFKRRNARDPNEGFNRTVGSDGSVGIFHETYIVERGNYEAIYGNMPVFGLAKATEHVRAVGGRETARRRLMRGENEPAVPSPE